MNPGSSEFNEKIRKLIDMVDYQDGAVVSREIMNEKSGTVTVFAFDKGQGLSEHTAPFDAMVYFLEGEVEVTISGMPLLLRQGEMVVLPSNQPHALKAIKRFKMMLTMMKPC
ncbi:MAG TPA: cupin domain-containing protein [Dehalococcoidia bacterium]